MTEAGSVIGTAQYLSPEQARGDEVTAASDCYAVGIVLYEMLTGRVPFDGEPRGLRGDEADQRRRRSRRASLEPRDPARARRRGPAGAGQAPVGALPHGRGDRAARWSRRAPRSTERRPHPRARRPRAPPTAQHPAWPSRSRATTRVAPPPPPPSRRRPAATALADRRGRHRAARARGRGRRRVPARAAAATPRHDPAGRRARAPPRPTQILRDAGLDVSQQSVHERPGPGGHRHRHRSGRRPARWTRATRSCCVVSGGPGQTTVPDVSGEQEDAARADARARRFQGEGDASEASDDVDEGVVIRQEPAGGTQADARQHGHHRGLERPGERPGARRRGAARRATAEQTPRPAGLHGRAT